MVGDNYVHKTKPIRNVFARDSGTFVFHYSCNHASATEDDAGRHYKFTF